MFAIVLPAVLGFLSYLVFLRRKRQTARYPPGPPGKPIIGNLLDVPLKKPWVKYLQWSKEYNSGIIYLNALNTDIVVLHTMEDANELMEKRSSVYSDRPKVPLFKLLRTGDLLPTLYYGDRWRRQRRVLQEGFKKEVIPSYHNVLTQKVHLLLGQLLHDPAEFREYCQKLSVSATMAVTYGLDVIPGQKNEIVEAADFAVATASGLLLPGRTLLNIFPVLMHIPSWFPGASTKRLALQAGDAMVKHKHLPFEFVRQNMAVGKSRDCVLARVLERREKHDGSYEGDEDVKYAVASVHLAGVETMHCAIEIFIFAMALHPLQQKKAHEEIDRVVGPGRLPTFEDRNTLPYLEALCREVLRWRPVMPLGFAHSTSEDDIYKGYFIPKGAVVLASNWALSRDETIYPEPESFRPERFFNEDGTLNDDSIPYTFGFGRRICPGRSLADSVLWLMMACVLSVFDISKAKDENGSEINVNPDEFTDSFVSHPTSFSCSIVPRSQTTVALIKAAEDIAQMGLQTQ